MAAIYQTKVKRLLAYSMIANMGYIILGFSLGGLSASYVSFFYLVIYTFIMLGLFAGLGMLREASNYNKKTAVKLTSLINLFEINPYLA